MLNIVFGLIASVSLIALAIQTLRIGDLKCDVACLKNGEVNLVRQREGYYQRLQDMTASRDHYAEMCDNANEEISRLNTKLQVVESSLRDEETSSSQVLSDKQRVISHLTDSLSHRDNAVRELKTKVNDLERRQTLKNHVRLTEGLTEIIRFVAANQWTMENNKAFAEAVASVGEVAVNITERREL